MRYNLMTKKKNFVRDNINEIKNLVKSIKSITDNSNNNDEEQ